MRKVSSHRIQRAGSGVGSSATTAALLPTEVSTSQQLHRRTSVQRRKSKSKSNASGAVRSAVVIMAAIVCTTLCWSMLTRTKDTGRMAMAGDGEHSRDVLPSFPVEDHILQLLRDAGVSELDQETLGSLPTWAEVT